MQRQLTFVLCGLCIQYPIIFYTIEQLQGLWTSQTIQQSRSSLTYTRDTCDTLYLPPPIMLLCLVGFLAEIWTNFHEIFERVTLGDKNNFSFLITAKVPCMYELQLTTMWNSTITFFSGKITKGKIQCDITADI